MAKSKTTEPRKNLERFRLHEFVVRVFNQKNMKEKIDIKFIEGEIKNLATKINDPTPNAAHADELEETVKDMFNVGADNDNEAPEIDAIVDELLVENDNEDPGTAEEEGSVGDKGKSKAKAIHPCSLANAILEGKSLIKKMGLAEIRGRIHKKNKRFEEFQDSICKEAISEEDAFTTDLDCLKDWSRNNAQTNYEKKHRSMLK